MRLIILIFTGLINKKFKTLITMLLFLSLVNCNDNGFMPNNFNEYNICYNKLMDGNKWSVILSNVHTKAFHCISNSNNNYDDYNPVWSPDGNYIAFYRKYNNGQTDIILYNITHDSDINITPDEEYNATSPLWLNNNKIIFSSHKIGEKHDTKIIDKDGSEIKSLLAYQADIFLSSNDDCFIYQPLGTNTNLDYQVYKHTIQSNNSEFILDLKSIGEEYTKLFGYNPNNQELLLLVADVPNITNKIATYDLNSRKVNIVSEADSGWIYLRPRYSNNFSKILFEKKNYSGNIDKLVIWEKGVEKNIVNLSDKDEWIDFNEISFSPCDNYLIYAKNINQSSEWVSWKSYIYIVNLNSLENMLIDEGRRPQWGPR